MDRDDLPFQHEQPPEKGGLDGFAKKFANTMATVTLPPKDYVYMTMLHSAYMWNVQQAMLVQQLVGLLEKATRNVSHTTLTPGQIKHYRTLKASPDVKRALILASKVRQDGGVFTPKGERIRQGEDQ